MKKRIYVAEVQGNKSKAEIDSYFREKNSLKQGHWVLVSTKCQKCTMTIAPASNEYTILAEYDRAYG